LGFSKGCTVTRNIAEQELDWRSAKGWWNATADESGWNPNRGEGQPSTSPSRGNSPEPAPRRLTLLLAEDNLPDALLVREALKMENLPLEVHVAPDGERALDFLERAGKDTEVPCPDVVLLDINLPKVDGFEVLRKIRASEKYKNLPVVVVTSSDSPADRNEAARFGAGYFRKPPNYEEFLKIGPVLRQVLQANGLLSS
jgi:CheY-like chemotaxis protein